VRRYLLIGVAAALLAVPSVTFGGNLATVTVEAGGLDQFGPKTLTKRFGTGSILWRWDADGTTSIAHNVRQDDKLFYSGPPTASNPSGFTVSPSAGTYHYYCEVHGSPNGGMDGTIRVQPLIQNKTATRFQVEWANGLGETGNAYDVRYRVDLGPWQIWKNDIVAKGALFGYHDQPVNIAPGHTYDIQVRSEKKADPSKVSDWSPVGRASY